MSQTAQQIIAHRGASYLAPENTLAAVKLAYTLGADAVEIDIRLSKDKQLMVIHDADTQRTAPGTNLIIKESEAAVLRKLDVGSWKDPEFMGERMPLLEEVMALVPSRKKLIVEIKTGPKILPYLAQKVKESGISNRLTLISFKQATILKARELMPELPVFWLRNNWVEHTMEDVIALAKSQGLRGLDVHYKLVDEAFMEKMRNQGLEVWVYTVNEPRKGKALFALGVKGLTTDRPQWLRSQLK